LNIKQYTVLLDTATLVPAVLRDLILRLVLKNFFTVRWSEDTLIELERTLTQKLGYEMSKISGLILNLKKTFPLATVTRSNYDALVPLMQNEDKDRHVLAAAIISGAMLIFLRMP
jgi:predicted nucleic acid-binding protein